MGPHLRFRDAGVAQVRESACCGAIAQTLIHVAACMHRLVAQPEVADPVGPPPPLSVCFNVPDLGEPHRTLRGA